MEPPAKRLRILQSVEVDEENPDYIHARQKQQQKFKGRLESIFAKYGSMHESMSDEIDMRQNRVVVDRGHLRRLVRQVKRKETILLDNLGMAAGQEPEDEVSEKEEGSEESEDELAPTQQTKPNKRQLEATEDGQQETFAGTIAHPLPGDSNQQLFQYMATPARPIVQAGVQHVPDTPNPAANPAANLMQLVQFPQTPAGQQAQSTFYTTLAQTIDQAIQQAVRPLVSNIIATTLNVQLPPANVVHPPTTPVAIGDKIAPATDPKWFFPPLAAESPKPQLVQSTPMPAPKKITSTLISKPTQPTTKDVSQRKQDRRGIRMRAQVTRTTNNAEVNSTRPIASEPVDSSKPQFRRASPRVEIQKRSRGRPREYVFTEEDDIYISKRRELHKRTWSEIRNSQRKWEGWPEEIFALRWNTHLKDKKLHLQEPLEANPDPRDSSMPHITPEEAQFPENEPVTPTIAHHLPTPSSSEREDRPEETEQSKSAHIGHVFSSSAHFDDDERDLLSLASDDTDEEQLLNSREDMLYPTQEDMILPSVEMAEFIDEHMLQRGLLEDLPIKDAGPPAIAAAMVTVKTEPQHTSPSSRRQRKAVPLSFRTVPATEDEDEDIDGVDASPARITGGAFLCAVSQKSFKSARNLQRHQANPRATHKNTQPKNCSLDLVGNDEIQAPATPHIKREFSTPPPTSFALSTPAFQTPNSLSQGSGVPSSSSKSTSKLDRKTFLKEVKQSWTKKSTPGSKTLAKKGSFSSVQMKRGWAADAESEDELAM